MRLVNLDAQVMYIYTETCKPGYPGNVDLYIRLLDQDVHAMYIYNETCKSGCPGNVHL
jgi:hypothetical protein